jgi:hypothetical protein
MAPKTSAAVHDVVVTGGAPRAGSKATVMTTVEAGA